MDENILIVLASSHHARDGIVGVVGERVNMTIYQPTDLHSITCKCNAGLHQIISDTTVDL